MRRILAIVIVSAFAAGIASGQVRRNAIEVTTGYPCVLFSFEYPNFHGEGGKSVTNENEPYGVNIGYTHSWTKRWEYSAILNLHLAMYDVARYPLKTIGQYGHEYDFSAPPIYERSYTELYGSFSFVFRYKWIVKGGFTMYSALGAGIVLAFPIPMPYVAPLGMKIGKGRVYCVVEANVGPANTFGMAGVGVRL